MSFKESERKFTPFKFDFRKYVPIKYYAPPEEVNDEELDRQLSQFEDKIKQFKHHEMLTRTAAPVESGAARWENICERYLGFCLLFSPVAGKIVSQSFYGRFHCRRLWFRTTIQTFMLMLSSYGCLLLCDDRISPVNWHYYKQPAQEVRHHQQLVETFNMFQDVSRIKYHEAYPNRKDFDAAVSNFNLRNREAKRAYLMDLYKSGDLS